MMYGVRWCMMYSQILPQGTFFVSLSIENIFENFLKHNLILLNISYKWKRLKVSPFWFKISAFFMIVNELWWIIQNKGHSLKVILFLLLLIFLRYLGNQYFNISDFCCAKKHFLLVIFGYNQSENRISKPFFLGTWMTDFLLWIIFYTFGEAYIHILKSMHTHFDKHTYTFWQSYIYII